MFTFQFYVLGVKFDTGDPRSMEKDIDGNYLYDGPYALLPPILVYAIASSRAAIGDLMEP